MTTPSYELRPVETAADLAEVRALRRATFEVELGYDYGSLSDELDERSLILLCSHEGRTVGTA